MPSPVTYVKTLLVGRPRETSSLEHERLSKKLALAVFSSDALSSSAYATEEMLLILIAGGSLALGYSIPLAVLITVVLGIVISSYRQTVHAYPGGASAYLVASDNLGKYPGLVAASALLIDYVLTVAVSIAAGVAAVVSAAPELEPYRVLMAVGAIALVTVLNLRGVRESGVIFAIPTYAYIVLIGATVAWGLIRYVTFGYRVPEPPIVEAAEPITLFLILRAFSHGSTALTGVEAISDGVGAFKPPVARNAATTLAVMGVILGTLFIGLTILSRLYNIQGPTEDPHRTVVALIALAVFGQGGLFLAVQTATALILFLAANTSYADFPRLSAFLARDRFAPRQLLNRGDKLAYSNGILALGMFASLLIVVYEADVSRIISLYVVGVFTSFTLSQYGMVRHWQRKRADEPAWRRNMLINGVGAATTLAVGGIVLSTKFLDGAWLVVLGIPLLLFWLNTVNRHYGRVAAALRDPERRPPPARGNHVVLLVGTHPQEEEVRAFVYADRVRTENFQTVHFAEKGDPKGLEAAWVRALGLLPTTPALEIVKGEGSPRRALRRYIDRLRARVPSEDFVTVVISERVRGTFRSLIGAPQAFLLKASILFAPGIVVTDVPYLGGRDRAALDPRQSVRHVAIVLVSGVHNATLHALDYAEQLDRDELHSVHIAIDQDEARKVEWDWQDWDAGLPLDIVDSPYRDINGPLLSYVRSFTADGRTLVTLILPEFLVSRWWHNILHNQNALQIKRLFISEPDVIVTSVPYRLENKTREPVR